MTTQNRLYLLVGGPPVLNIAMDADPKKVRPIKFEDVFPKDAGRWLRFAAANTAEVGRLAIQWQTQEGQEALLKALQDADLLELMPEAPAKPSKLEDDQARETLYVWYEGVLHYKLVTIGLPGAPEFKSAAVQALAKEQRVMPPMPFVPQLPPRPDDNKPNDADD